MGQSVGAKGRSFLPGCLRGRGCRPCETYDFLLIYDKIYKPSKLGQTDWHCFGVWSEFISGLSMQDQLVSTCSGCDLCHRG